MLLANILELDLGLRNFLEKLPKDHAGDGTGSVLLFHLDLLAHFPHLISILTSDVSNFAHLPDEVGCLSQRGQVDLFFFEDSCQVSHNLVPAFDAESEIPCDAVFLKEELFVVAGHKQRKRGYFFSLSSLLEFRLFVKFAAENQIGGRQSQMQNFIGVLVYIANLLDKFPALLDNLLLVSTFLLYNFGKVGLDRLVLVSVGRKLELIVEGVEFDVTAMLFLAKEHAILPANGESPAFVALHLTILL